MKRIAIFATACTLALCPTNAQVSATDFSHSPVSPGSWAYRVTPLGSEASFVDSTGTARMTLACSRGARQVLTQIIVEEEARGSTMLPVNFLKQLIGLYGNSMQGMVPQYLEAAMDAFQRNQSAMQDAFGGKMFADLAKRNMEMFEGASRAFTGGAQKPKAKPAKSQSESEIDQLKAELAALRDKIDRLSK